MEDKTNNTGTMSIKIENLEMGSFNIGSLEVDFHLSETDGTIQVETSLLGKLIETIATRFGDSINELLRTEAAAIRARTEVMKQRQLQSASTRSQKKA